MNNARTVILICLLAILTLMSIGWYMSRPQAQVSADDMVAGQLVPNQDTVSNDANSTVAGADPKTADSVPQSKTVKGTTVELVSAKVINTGIEVGVCYPTPDGGEWYPMPGHLFYGNYEILPDEAELLSEETADGTKMGKHCELIRYRIDDLSTITMPVRFSLLGYFAVPKEIPPCENFQLRLNTNSKAKAYGLKALCKEDGQGGISVSLNEKASSVAQDKAEEVLNEIVKGKVEGPWEFTIDQFDK
jgi:hypothetical protein